MTFLQKMAKQLNISRDRIKVVGIWAGSVVLRVSIEPNPDLPDDASAATELEDL